MKLRFLGTRGEIEARSQRHRRHSSLLVERGRGRVMIDCGADWLGRFERLRVQAIVLTHAHPDHCLGLRNGADCPVYATPETWNRIKSFPIARRRVLRPRRPIRIAGIGFEAFPVEHSVGCPAVGFRVRADRRCFFYAPDLVFIHQPHAALDGVDLYIGDGASVSRPIVRSRGARRIGHASIRAQIGCCARHAIGAAVFTHCGTQIVTGDEKRIRKDLAEWGRNRKIRVRVAFDGMRINL